MYNLKLSETERGCCLMLSKCYCCMMIMIDDGGGCKKFRSSCRCSDFKKAK